MRRSFLPRLVATIVTTSLLLVTLATSSAFAQTPPPPAPATATTRATSTTRYSSDAAEAVDSTGWSAAALLGIAFNNVGFGIGARGGYTLENHVYIGGTLAYHFGSSGVSAFLLGAEGGYDFTVGPVVIRPFLGLGFAMLSVSYTTVTVTPVGGVAPVSASASSTNFAAWPGCAVLYSFPQNDRFFVGGDARILIISGYDTFGIFGFGGMKF